MYTESEDTEINHEKKMREVDVIFSICKIGFSEQCDVCQKVKAYKERQ